MDGLIGVYKIKRVADTIITIFVLPLHKTCNATKIWILVSTIAKQVKSEIKKHFKKLIHFRISNRSPTSVFKCSFCCCFGLKGRKNEIFRYFNSKFRLVFFVYREYFHYRRLIWKKKNLIENERELFPGTDDRKCQNIIMLD